MLKIYSASAKISAVLSSAFIVLIDFLRGHRLTSTCTLSFNYLSKPVHPQNLKEHLFII